MTGPGFFRRAVTESIALAPGSAVVLGEGGRFAVYMGRFAARLAATHRGVTLDPLNPRSPDLLGEALYFARRYQQTLAAFEEVKSLDPDYTIAYSFRGLAYYRLGDFQNALSSCEAKS